MNKYNLVVTLCFFLTAATFAESSSGPAIIPEPQNIVLHPGIFKLMPNTRIYAESAAFGVEKYLTERLRRSTGYPFKTDTKSYSGDAIKNSVYLTTGDANPSLGAEGYELTVAPDAVVIRAPTQAGLFYGVQTLLQLLPPEILYTNLMPNVIWQMPCVQIEDWPRFKWRGLMLDVSRHFFSKSEIETILDAMAFRKMNVFHWHLTDDQGWRIEIKKYPRLTQIGAWRSDVGFGFESNSTTAYGPDGRYGGFYTQDDVRELVAYAAARHIMIVPEIEMPGHSMAALAAYPQFSCTDGPFTLPDKSGIFDGIYCAGNEETFGFLEDILMEVFQLFPSKYIHIGGDEVPTNNWANCPKDEAVIRREGLKGSGQLESYFIRRIEKFVNANGHTLIGWSEIARGGLATNAVVMDWIGGGQEAASAGHDVVMAPTDFCYFCYYPSLDRPPNLHAYRPYLPLKQVYAFEPIPTNLGTQYSSHILGAEACVWTPDIPSIKDAEEMAFPRLSALAEIAWSPKSSRNWDDFLRRLNVEYQRLAICGINYWKDTSTEIGEWKPSQIAGQDNILSWDATREIDIPGRYRLSLDCGVGKNDLKIKWAKLLEGDQVIASDIHTGFTGTSRLRARDWNYFFDVPAYTKGARYTVQVSVAGEGGSDSSGVVFLGDRTAQIESNTNQVNSASHLPFQNISPESILTTMQRVADWQLEHPPTNPPASWIQAVGDIGIMALAGISGDAKYRNAMLTMSETNSWQLGAQMYNADDQCIGQVYAELYLSYHEPQMIAPMRKEFDFILANPAKPNGFKANRDQDPWTWCDALFMAPPAWARLYAATGDRRYLDFAVTNWWRTTDYLYDQQEHLFFRDGTSLKSGESNGKKVFWGRGNGWVMAGMVRTLQCLPINDPARSRFEQLFKDMAEKILVCQQPDGLWRANLLEPESNSLPETSGSGLYTYAFAWGVNQGLLDRAKFEPAVRKAWAALASCVDAGGRLTHVQPVGKDPQPFAEDSTAPYGVGAFLLAGSEMYKLTLLGKSRPMEVKVKNPAAFYRESETIELNLPGKLAMMGGLSARILDSQSYRLNNEEKFLFQVDLGPNETRTFYIFNATNLISVPPPIVKTFARYVPERDDDFAWESDRIAHRIYGQALIKAEGTISSGQDVWIKKNRGLIVNRMYDTKNYHYNNGEFMDDYRVGNSRGCGGLGIWDGQKLFVSSNWRNWTLITSGPIRSEFELTYDLWNAGEGRLVSETKHFSIDAGSWFTKVQSTLTVEDKLPLTVGVGLAERACGPGGEELVAEDQAEGWMSYWQPEDKPKGTIGVAMVLPKGSIQEFTNDAPELSESKIQAVVPQPTYEGAPPIRNLLAITKVAAGKPLTYYFGACWDRSGDFTNDVQWADYVKRFAERRDQPLQVTLGN